MFSRAFVKIREYSIKIGKHCDANRVKECKFDDFSLKYLHCEQWWTNTYVLKFWSGDVQKDVNLIHLVESKRMAMSIWYFSSSIWFRKSASTHPRTISAKFGSEISQIYRLYRSISLTSIYFAHFDLIRLLRSISINQRWSECQFRSHAEPGALVFGNFGVFSPKLSEHMPNVV